MAWHEVEEMTKRGVPGVRTWGFYDGWGANYMMEAAHGHNSIGRFYETFGNGGADTRERTVSSAQTTRQRYRPNPPLAKVKWSQRNNVNLQQSALLLSMNFTARNRETFLRNFWLKSKRSVAKAATEGAAAYVIDHGERPNEAASLVEQLKLHGVEVQRLSAEAEVAGVKHPEGSYVVRMDQPYSRLADMLFDRQYYNANDTAPYDDTGWTLPALRNLKSTRVTDAAILKAPMAPAGAPAAPQGRVEGQGSVYAVHHNADRALASFRFALADVPMQAAEAGFEGGGRKFGAGSFLIPAVDAAARKKMEAAAVAHGIVAVALKEAPQVPTHTLAAPRIALVHNWMNTQNEGWFRLALETTRITYTYISDQNLARITDLRSRFDVIILGPSSSDARRLVNGMPKRGEPIPWESSNLTPNFGTSPDQTGDMRGGLGLEGLISIRRFVEQGGLFVTIAGNASLPIDFGLIDGVSIQPARELKARGSVLLAAAADPKSPILYGYGEKLPVYFNAAPIFDVNLSGGMGRGAGSGQDAGASERPSGRGGLDDPDVVQGRLPVRVAPPERPGEMSTEMMEAMRAYLPPPNERPRTVLKFADEKELLVSGMLAGGGELAGMPAVLDVPRGQGHYLLFALNPMWRQQSQGGYMLLLNAAMNFQSLNAGRPAVPVKPEVHADDDLLQ